MNEQEKEEYDLKQSSVSTLQHYLKIGQEISPENKMIPLTNSRRVDLEAIVHGLKRDLMELQGKGEKKESFGLQDCRHDEKGNIELMLRSSDSDDRLFATVKINFKEQLEELTAVIQEAIKFLK